MKLLFSDSSDAFVLFFSMTQILLEDRAEY